VKDGNIEKINRYFFINFVLCYFERLPARCVAFNTNPAPHPNQNRFTNRYANAPPQQDATAN